MVESMGIPENEQAFYDTCAAGARAHTGPEALFSQLETDPYGRYPAQRMDAVMVKAAGLAVGDLVAIGGRISPNLPQLTDEFVKTQRGLVDDLYQLQYEDHQNLIFAGPHSLIYDIALPPLLYTAAVEKFYGIDETADRNIIVAKSFAWDGFEGVPATEVLSWDGNIFFSIPRSDSGDKVDSEDRQLINQAVKVQLDRQLARRSQRLTLGVGGATNRKLNWRGRTIAELQHPIEHGTATMLTDPRATVVPMVPYLDAQRNMAVRFGRPSQLNNEWECQQLGGWLARQYQELSGIETIQIPSRGTWHRIMAESGGVGPRLQLARDIARTAFGQKLDMDFSLPTEAD